MANQQHVNYLSELETISSEDFRQNVQSSREHYEYDAESANNFVAGSKRILDSLRRQSVVENPTPRLSSSSSSTFEELDKEILIDMVRNYACIWDMRSHTYKDGNKKKLAWHQIYMALQQNHEIAVLKKEWKNLRDAYTRCVQKRTSLSRSGSKSTRLPTCNFYEQLKFLSYASSGEELSVSNISIPDDDPDISVHSPILVTPTPSIPEIQTRSIPNISTPMAPYRQNIVKKRKKSIITNGDVSEVDKLLLEELKATKPQVLDEPEDSNSLFCKSLVKTLNELSPEKNMYARIKIIEVLFEIKFDKTV